MEVVICVNRSETCPTRRLSSFQPKKIAVSRRDRRGGFFPRTRFLAEGLTLYPMRDSRITVMTSLIFLFVLGVSRLVKGLLCKPDLSTPGVLVLAAFYPPAIINQHIIIDVHVAEGVLTFIRRALCGGRVL